VLALQQSTMAMWPKRAGGSAVSAVNCPNASTGCIAMISNSRLRRALGVIKRGKWSDPGN